jgi:hypothetical protein
LPRVISLTWPATAASRGDVPFLSHLASRPVRFELARQACNKALQGKAKRKYFEHSGALLTADGTDDNLIKLEGTPPGYRIQI